MKKILAFAVALSTIMGVCAQAKTVQVTIDSPQAYVSDEYIQGAELDAAPYIQNDITMVPLSFITDTFGVEIEWEHDTKQVTIMRDDKTIVLKIGDINATVIVGEETSSFELIAAPVIVNDRTMVPLRFISETLDNTVQYVAPTRQVVITDEEPAVTVGTVALYKSMFRAYALLNSQYQLFYGQDVFNELVYSNLVQMAAVKDQWSVIDPDDSISDYDMEMVNAVSDEQWAVQGILSANVVQLLQIGNAQTRAYDFLSRSVTQDVIDEYYGKNYVCAKHILLSTEGLTGTKKDAVRRQAESVLKKAKGTADFDELINEYGEDPGMTSNPDGYVFTYGEMVEPFEKAAFELEDNEISDLVETDYGYHIIKKIPLPAVTEEIKAQVVNSLVGDVINSMVMYAPVVNNISTQQLFEYLNQASVG